MYSMCFLVTVSAIPPLPETRLFGKAFPCWLWSWSWITKSIELLANIYENTGNWKNCHIETCSLDILKLSSATIRRQGNTEWQDMAMTLGHHQPAASQSPHTCKRVYQMCLLAYPSDDCRFLKARAEINLNPWTIRTADQMLMNSNNRWLLV